MSKPNFLTLLLLLTSAILVKSEIIVQLNDDIEDCSIPDQKAGRVDFASNLDVHQETDNDFFFNGSIKVLKDFKSPVHVIAYAEKFIRGQWNVEVFNKDIPDLCATLGNPLETYYFFTSQMKPNRCPFKAGTDVVCDMIKATLSPSLPRTLIGKWRFTAKFFYVDHKTHYDCFRLYGDLVDDSE